MTPALDFLAEDRPLRRQVLVALVAIDPFTGRTVSEGLEVTAEGLDRRPIVNHSGHFVWQDEGAAQPTVFHLKPRTPAYQPMQVPAPFLPAPGVVGARLVRVTLRPSAAYPFPDAAVVIRGRLLDTAGGAPLADAQLRLQWRNDALAWVDAAASFVTGTDGRFAAGLTTPPGAKPPLNTRPFRARLAVTRAGLTLVTPEADLPPGAQALPPGSAPPAGEVAWDALQLP